MTEFHNNQIHTKPFALLFHSHNLEQKFKERAPDYKCIVIRDKEETRLNAMLTSAGDIGAKFIQLQTLAVSAIAVASSPDEQLLMTAGLIKIIPGGLAICPTCLADAILTCQENLEVLKDIQEAVSKYAVE
jgi:hypothetical protein